MNTTTATPHREDPPVPGARQVGGWWLPGDDTHMARRLNTSTTQVAGRATYQQAQLAEAVRQVPAGRRRVAVDVGAHIGTSAYYLAQWFRVVLAYEPNSDNRCCLLANIRTSSRIVVSGHALGEKSMDSVAMGGRPGNSGYRWLEPHRPGPVRVRRLDDFGVGNLDLLKMDCEGYEQFVLRGALETVKRCRPAVLIEQEPACQGRYGLEHLCSLKLLRGLGYRVVARYHHDYVLKHGGVP